MYRIGNEEIEAVRRVIESKELFKVNRGTLQETQNAEKALCELMGSEHALVMTSGHAALMENYFLDDGAYLVTRLLIALAKAAKDVKKLTLAPVAARLNELLGNKVTFATDVVGEDAKAKVAACTCRRDHGTCHAQRAGQYSR